MSNSLLGESSDANPWGSFNEETTSESATSSTNPSVNAISGGSSNSLNEPVSVTIKRDIDMVSKKMRHVLLPTNSDPEATIKELRDCM